MPTRALTGSPAALSAPRGGQHDMEARTLAGSGAAPEAAVMGADDGARDGQPQAEAARLGGIERLEELGVLVRGEPGAAIAEADLHRAVLHVHLAGAHREPALLRGNPGHGIASVDHEVQHHLLKLDPVAVD